MYHTTAENSGGDLGLGGMAGWNLLLVLPCRGAALQITISGLVSASEKKSESFH